MPFTRRKVAISLSSCFDVTLPFSECPLIEISPETEEAINEIDKIIESEPHDSEAYLLRGWAYATNHRYPQSISDLNNAIELSASV